MGGIRPVVEHHLVDNNIHPRMVAGHAGYRGLRAPDCELVMTISTGNSSTPQWTTTMVTPRTDVASGQPVKGHLVSFATKAGNRSEVFIPDSVTDLNQAKKMIADRVAFVDGLGSLSG